MRYDDYVQKIRAFKQYDTLLCVTEALWKAWQHEDEKLSETQKKELLLVRAYAPRILCIAAATGNNHRNVSPHLKNILDLSRLHLEVDESISDKAFIGTEVDAVAEEISKTPLAKYTIPKDLIRVSVSTLFLQRLLRSQWDAAAYSMRHVFRGWMIYQHLDQRTGGKAGKAVRTLFNQTPVDAIRSAFCTFTMASDTNEGKKFQGIFDLNRSNVESDLESRFSIDRETIRQLAVKLSKSVESYREWHDADVLSLPEVYRKYAPLPLYRSPVIPAEEIWTGKPRGSIENIFLCPSPHIHLASLSDLFVRELLANPQLIEGVNLSSELGYAGEDYLEEALPVIMPDGKIIRLRAGKEKAADFVVECDEAIFVIEAKKCLGGAEAKTISRPIEAVSIWCRLLESYEQCSATIQRDLKSQMGKKPIIALVVVNDTILGEQGIFDLIAHHAGIHKSLGLEHVEVLSLDQLERTFQNGTTGAITDAIVAKWKAARENPVMGKFYSLAVERRGREPLKLSHLEGAFDAVFPGLAFKS